MFEYQAEYVLMIRDALMRFASGSTVAEATDYSDYRKTLLGDPAFRDNAPALFRECRTLSDFWDYIRQQGIPSTRRELIRRQFEPLLRKLEGRDPEPRAAPTIEPKVRPAQGQRRMPVEADDPNVSDRRRVFVVHGRNQVARDAMFEFLRALDLDPLEWSEVVRATSHTNPGVLEVVETGMRLAHAVLVLMTGDDDASLRPQFLKAGDPKEDAGPTPQARPNVLFEAGMALALGHDRTILVSLGHLRPLTDLSGLHIVRLDNSVERRQDLAERLAVAGCPVKIDRRDWQRTGDFKAALDLANSGPGNASAADPSDLESVKGQWQAILEGMPRTPRAAFLDAEPALRGSTLQLLFRYGFHFKKASEQRDMVERLVKQTFGPEIGFEMRLKEQPPPQQTVPSGGDAAPSALTTETPITSAEVDKSLSDRWEAVLERLPRAVRAVLLDAQPSLDGLTLRLVFPYGFHHRKASDHLAAIEAVVREIFGPDTALEMRLAGRV